MALAEAHVNKPPPRLKGSWGFFSRFISPKKMGNDKLHFRKLKILSGTYISVLLFRLLVLILTSGALHIAAVASTISAASRPDTGASLMQKHKQESLLLSRWPFSPMIRWASVAYEDVCGLPPTLDATQSSPTAQLLCAQHHCELDGENAGENSQKCQKKGGGRTSYCSLL